MSMIKKDFDTNKNDYIFYHHKYFIFYYILSSNTLSLQPTTVLQIENWEICDMVLTIQFHSQHRMYYVHVLYDYSSI